MARWVIVCMIAAALWGSGYFLGRSHVEIKIVREQVEVIKYVEKKKAEIAARPNAGRDDLLKLMHAGQL